MEAVLEWVRTVVYYLIFVSAIMHILPDNQYAKYVQLFIGLLLILITMEPIISLFDQDNLIETLYQKAAHYQEFESQKEMIEKLNEVEKRSLYDSYENQLEIYLTQWFEEKGFQADNIEITIEDNELQSIEAKLKMENKMYSLEEKQKTIRQMKNTLGEIYNLNAERIILKIS